MNRTGILILIPALVFTCCKDNSVSNSQEEQEPIEFDGNPATTIRVEMDGDLAELTWRDNSSDEDGFIIQTSFDNESWSEIGRTGKDTTILSSRQIEFREETWFRVLTYKRVDEDRDSTVSSSSTKTIFKTPNVQWTQSPQGPLFSYSFDIESTSELIYSNLDIVIHDEDNQEILYQKTFPKNSKIEINKDSVGFDLGGRQRIEFVAELFNESSHLTGEIKSLEVDISWQFNLLSPSVLGVDSLGVPFTTFLNRSDTFYTVSVLDNQTAIKVDTVFGNTIGSMYSRISVPLEDLKSYDVELHIVNEQNTVNHKIGTRQFKAKVDRISGKNIVTLNYVNSIPDSVYFRVSHNVNENYPVILYKRDSFDSQFSIHEQLPIQNRQNLVVGQYLSDRSLTYSFRAKMLYSDTFSNELDFEFGPSLFTFPNSIGFYNVYCHVTSNNSLIGGFVSDLTQYFIETDEYVNWETAGKQVMGYSPKYAVILYPLNNGIGEIIRFDPFLSREDSFDFNSSPLISLVEKVRPSSSSNEVLFSIGEDISTENGLVGETEFVNGVYRYKIDEDRIDELFPNHSLLVNIPESFLSAVQNKGTREIKILGEDFSTLVTVNPPMGLSLTQLRYDKALDILFLSVDSRVLVFRDFSTLSGLIQPDIERLRSNEGLALSKDEFLFSGGEFFEYYNTNTLERVDITNPSNSGWSGIMYHYSKTDSILYQNSSASVFRMKFGRNWKLSGD